MEKPLHMKTKFLLFLFVAAIFVCCDPIQVLIIKTRANKNESITLYADDISDLRKTSKEKVVIKVPYIDSISKNEKIFRYGVGGWSEYEMNLLIQKIDSIIIIKEREERIIKEPDSIKNFLMKRRSGWAESILTIETK